MDDEERMPEAGPEPEAEPEAEEREESPQPVMEVEGGEGAPPPEPKPPSRLSRWARSALRWGTGLAVVFVLGVAATWAARVRPQAASLNSLRVELNQTQDQVDALTSEVTTLRPLRQENSDLQTQLDDAELHLELLNVLVDLTSAQLAVVEKDPVGAQAALAGTDQRLAKLEGRLTGEHAQAIANMRDRLKLVLSELEDDSFAAKNDLEVLTKSVVSLERSLFGE